MEKNIDVSKEVLKVFLVLFLAETILNLLSFLIYPSIYDNITNLSVEVFLSIIMGITIFSLRYIERENILGYYLSLIIALMILYSAFTLNSNNIISIAVRNVASNYGPFPNPIILFWGVVILFISIRKILKLKFLKLSN
ncbi:MAG: hypothetical protein ACP5G1_02035 [Nanopusillaceae archaeon]